MLFNVKRDSALLYSMRCDTEIFEREKSNLRSSQDDFVRITHFHAHRGVRTLVDIICDEETP